MTAFAAAPLTERFGTEISGLDLCEPLASDVRDDLDFETEVLVASVRHPIHVSEAALIGADVCTIPFKVIQQLAYHPLTDLGLAKFLEDAKKTPKV